MRIVFTLFITLLCTLSYGQNLVPNPSFESYNSLPDGYCQWNRCNVWNNVSGVVGCGSNASPDYYHVNAISAVTLPNTSAGTSLNPNTGDAIMGFLTWSGSLYPNFREYLSIQLSQTLVPGNTYEVSFYLSNGNTPYYGHGSNNIGLHFSNSQLTQPTNQVINVIPQIEITTVFFSHSWQLFTFNYTPTANLDYLTIGNFRDDNATSNQQFVNSTPRAYYFIDDVSIITTSNNPTITGDTSICLGDSTTLTVVGDTNNNYNWVDNLFPNVTLSSDSTLAVSPTIPTTYNVYTSTDTLSFTVNIDTPPTIDLGNDTTLCLGQTLILDASAPNATYLWQDNSTNPTFNVSQQGIYWVELTNICGTATDTINVTYFSPQSVNLGNDTTICQGQTLTLDAFIPNAAYLWQDNSINSIFDVSQPGTYWVQITNNCGVASDTINVSYSQFPVVDLGNNLTLCEGETLTLDATTSNATYLWQDNSTQPILDVTELGIYWVEVTVANCSLTYTILIDNQDCEVILEIPNVFTPNNDGSNDLFVPVKSEGIASMNTMIFNRWGNKIFESDELLIEWNGEDVNDGTYFWIVNYVDIQGEAHQVKGHVTLLK